MVRDGEGPRDREVVFGDRDGVLVFGDREGVLVFGDRDGVVDARDDAGASKRGYVWLREICRGAVSGETRDDLGGERALA